MFRLFKEKEDSAKLVVVMFTKHLMWSLKP